MVMTTRILWLSRQFYQLVPTSFMTVKLSSQRMGNVKVPRHKTGYSVGLAWNIFIRF